MTRQPLLALAVFFSVFASARAETVFPAGEEIGRLDQGVLMLQRGRYEENDHRAVSQALESLLKKCAEEPKFGGIKLRVDEATEAERVFWKTLTPEQLAGSAVIPPESATELKKRLAALSSALSQKTEDAATSSSPPPTRHAAPEPEYGAGIIAALNKSDAANPSNSRQFWDRNTRRGETSEPAVRAAPGKKSSLYASREPAGLDAGKGSDLDGVAVPDLDKTSEEADTPGHENQARRPWPASLHGSVMLAAAVSAEAASFTGMPLKTAPPRERAETADPSLPCHGVMTDYPRLSSLCPGFPNMTPVLGGLLDALWRQFATAQGIALNLAFLLLGMILSVVASMGVVALGAVILIVLALLAATVGPLTKECEDAVKAWLNSKPGTAAHSRALFKVGSLLSLAVMTLVGMKIGRTATAKATVASWQATLSSKMTSLGITKKVAALDTQLPAMAEKAVAKITPAAGAAGSLPDILKILEEQPLRAKKFFEQVKCTQQFKSLPKGIPGRYHSGFETIRRLFADQKRVLALMQEFEDEVIANQRSSGKTLEAAREAVLSSWEKRGGFKPNIVEIEKRGYSTKEWRKMLSEGAMFKDGAFKDINRQGSLHGYETHRLQWNLVMREMAANPQSFGEVTQAAELFKFTGTVSDATLDWKGTGLSAPSTLWYELFDSMESNFSSPEFFRTQHAYFPGVGEWY